MAAVRPELAMPSVTMVSYSIIYRQGLRTTCREPRPQGSPAPLCPSAGGGSEPLAAVCRREDFSLVQLVTPTTPADRALRMARHRGGRRHYLVPVERQAGG